MLAVVILKFFIISKHFSFALGPANYAARPACDPFHNLEPMLVKVKTQTGANSLGSFPALLLKHDRRLMRQVARHFSTGAQLCVTAPVSSSIKYRVPMVSPGRSYKNMHIKGFMQCLAHSKYLTNGSYYGYC